MERTQMLYAVTIAKCGSFTSAARILHLAQPSLSLQIKLLEEELGVLLFERTGKGIRLTEAGQRFVEQAERILRQTDVLKKEMEDYSVLRKGRLHIGALSTMASLGIPALLRSFNAQYPDIELTITESGSADLISILHQGNIDAAFAIYEADNKAGSALHRIPLLTSRVYAAMNKNHPLAQKEFLTYEELCDQPLAITNRNFNFYRMIFRKLEEQGFIPKISCTCNQIETCMVLADMGFGITLCTEETGLYYDHVSLSFVPLEPAIERTVSLFYRSDPAYHPVLSSFIEFINAYEPFLHEAKKQVQNLLLPE